MRKMIQVRNVSERLHRELMRRAAKRGQALTDYIEEILEREVARPLPDEVFRRIHGRSAVPLREPAADVIREERARKR